METQRWWREPELAWLIILVVLAYFLRAGQLPIRGEESTRAQIAFEGDHVPLAETPSDPPGEVFGFGKAMHREIARESRRFIRHSRAF